MIRQVQVDGLSFWVDKMMTVNVRINTAETWVLFQIVLWIYLDKLIAIVKNKLEYILKFNLLCTY